MRSLFYFFFILVFLMIQNKQLFSDGLRHHQVPNELIIKHGSLSDEKTNKILNAISGRNDYELFLDINVATVYGEELKPAKDFLEGVKKLVSYFEKIPTISITYNKNIDIKSPELFENEVIFLTSEKPFKLTDSEHDNLIKYLLSGGFVFIDNGTPDEAYSDTEKSLRWMVKSKDIKDVSTNIGLWSFRPLSYDNPIYKSCFTFHDGPPRGKVFSPDSPGFWGLWLGNRLAAVYSDWCHSYEWKNRPAKTCNIPHIAIGINIIIYAVLQEGGLYLRNNNY